MLQLKDLKSSLIAKGASQVGMPNFCFYTMTMLVGPFIPRNFIRVLPASLSDIAQNTVELFPNK